MPLVPLAPRPLSPPLPARAPVPAGRHPWPATLQTSVELGAVDTAPGCARGILRECLARWGLAHLRDPGEEITAELVANAIAASVAKAPEGTGPRPVMFWATVRDGELCLRVWDPDPTPPPRDLPLPDDNAESGRGLFLVNAFSRRWGWHPAHQGGKFTWATLEATAKPGPEIGASCP